MTIPKPLLPLGDVPILEVVLQQLANAGFERVVITLGHMAPIFQAHLGDGSKFKMDISYFLEDEPLGTAGSLRMIDDLDDDFLVMNGDLLTTLNYAELLKFHTDSQAMGTISLQKRQVIIDYGVIRSGEDGRLTEYDEKPTIPYEVSMGVNALNKGCLEFIPPGQFFDMPQLMLDMKDAGKNVMCYRPDCYWKDIGRFDDFQEASADFDADPERFLSNA
jgi:NDP-sugar pyrophosphorylase family protein